MFQYNMSPGVGTLFDSWTRGGYLRDMGSPSGAWLWSGCGAVTFS